MSGVEHRCRACGHLLFRADAPALPGHASAQGASTIRLETVCPSRRCRVFQAVTLAAGAREAPRAA